MNEAVTTPIGLRGFVNRVRRASLTVKVMVLGGVVTALVVFAAFWALDVETRKTTRVLLAEELSRQQRTLLRLQHQNITQLISSAAIITQSPTLRSALETYRVEANLGGAPRADLVHTVERDLDNQLARIGGDLLLVTDNTGRVFASTARGAIAPRARTDFSRMAAVRAALDPVAPVDSGELAVLRDDGGRVNYQVAVYPLVLDGFAIGTLMLGERLDAGLVASARAAFEGDVVVTAGQAVIAGTLSDTSIAERLLRLPAPDTRALSTLSIELRGKEMIVAPLSLGQTQDGEPVRMWLMQPLDRTVRALSDPLRNDFIFYGVIAVVLAAAGSGVATRSALGPFRQFVGYMRSGAEGQQLDVEFRDRDLPAEVRTLTSSFQHLMRSISAKQQQLTHRTTELTAANALLVDEVRERKRVEEELLQRDEQLRQSQKLEAIGTLAGGIAHDFNNLITAVSGFTQLAMMQLEPDSPVTSDLRQVVEAADRAGHLTKQLLAFSRKQVMQKTVLDVDEVIHGLAPMLERLLGETISLQVNPGEDLARVLGDRGQLEQVILNLAINARDAMPHGGVLRIRTVNRARDGGHAKASSAEQVIITVSDTGAGIPPAIRDRIFEPFFTTKEPGKGTGLGLSTVYGIVKQSGGTIDLQSRVGFGTTFTIALPAAPDAGSDLPVDERVADFPRGDETVLLVEDDAAVRALARRTLEDCGYTVLPAAEPREALRLAETARIDVILSDMVMPNLSGAQFVERFLAKYPAPVVLFMSGYSDQSLVIDGRAMSAAFLRKPFSPATLARTIRDAIDASRQIPVSAIS